MDYAFTPPPAKPKYPRCMHHDLWGRDSCFGFFTFHYIPFIQQALLSKLTVSALFLF